MTLQCMGLGTMYCTVYMLHLVDRTELLLVTNHNYRFPTITCISIFYSNVFWLYSVRVLVQCICYMLLVELNCFWWLITTTVSQPCYSTSICIFYSNEFGLSSVQYVQNKNFSLWLITFLDSNMTLLALNHGTTQWWA